MGVFSLVFVRHGETLANKNGIIQGHQDEPLSDIGLRQAQQAGHNLRNERFTHMFSSDLSRASQTASAIHTANTASNCDVQLDKRLRERTYGIFEGKHFYELSEMAKKDKKTLLDFIPEGAEALHEVRLRAVSFFQDLCVTLAKTDSTRTDTDSSSTSTYKNQPPAPKKSLDASLAQMLPISDTSHMFEDKPVNLGAVLVVSHGGLIKELMTYFLEDLHSHFPGGGQLQVSPNTGISRFTVTLSDQGLLPCVKCVSLYDIGHLHIPV